MKYDRRPLKPELQLTQTQDSPFQELFIDTFTTEGKCYLSIVDDFSSRSTPEVVRALIKYLSLYGVPRRINTDPGAEFNNALFRELLLFYKINIHIGTPHNPNSMGWYRDFIPL